MHLMFLCYFNLSILILHILKPSGFINPSSRNILVIMDLSIRRMIIQNVFFNKKHCLHFNHSELYQVTPALIGKMDENATPGSCSSLSTAPPQKKKRYSSGRLWGGSFLILTKPTTILWEKEVLAKSHLLGDSSCDLFIPKLEITC